MFEHLKLLTERAIENGKDLSNDMGADYFAIRMVFGLFGEPANKPYHQLMQMAPSYDYDTCEDDFRQATEKTKLKSISKFKKICEFYGIDTSYNDEKLDAEAALYFLPEAVDKNFVLENGFYPLVEGGKTGYYFRSGETSFTAASNFVMEPLMHVYSKLDNKRIISVNNGVKIATLDMPSKSMISLEQFSGEVYKEGNYMFWGNKTQLMKILMVINDGFPVCYELKTLGWQPEGFFAWSNGVLAPTQSPPSGGDVAKATEGATSPSPGGGKAGMGAVATIDFFNELGIVKVDKTHYFSPSASDIYKDVRAEDDEYENDRYLTYHEPPISFEEWMQLMQEVYGAAGMTGIAYVFIGMFKDIIFKIDNNCPHLSCYGEKGSGKSKFAESVTALFLHDLQPFNLNHGTDFAFFNRLSRFRNCVTWFDEFDDQAIKEDRFQSIKGAYDGAGRERGKGTNKNKTEIARINSALLLTGQYLSTRDDNAALTRCIILPFTPDDSRSKKQIAAYDKLKRLEKKGLTGLIAGILPFRAEYEKQYIRLFPECFSELKEAVTNEGATYKERVVRNYCAALTSVKFFMERLKIKWPFSYEDFFEKCKNDVIRLSTLISESDSLANFWDTIVYLLETGLVIEGFHYRIQQDVSVKIKDDHGKGTKEVKLVGSTKLLYLRLTTVHKLYLEAFRRQNGQNGINMQSLQLYISSAKAFIGINNSMKFIDQQGNTTVTSSYVFNYDLLDVPLERLRPDEEEQKQMTEVTGTLFGEIKIQEVAGKEMLKFTLKVFENREIGTQTYQKERFYTCYYPNLQEADKIQTMNQLVIVGALRISKYKDRNGDEQLKYTIDVESVRLRNEQLEINDQNPDETPF